MSWTQADLAAIEKAIKSGALSVQFADRQVAYRSLDDMMRIRAMMRHELGLDAADRVHYAEFRKGPSSGNGSDFDTNS